MIHDREIAVPIAPDLPLPDGTECRLVEVWYGDGGDDMCPQIQTRASKRGEWEPLPATDERLIEIAELFISASEGIPSLLSIVRKRVAQILAG